VAENAVGYDLVLHCKKSPVSKKPTKTLPNMKTITQFIQKELSNGDDYKVEYLHVNRDSEFDYRKLYSKWLSMFINKEIISLDFDKFRKITDKVLKDFKEDHQIETT
jgi:hypothetical protein